MGTILWNFVNSPVGLMIVGTILAGILGAVFKAQPAWQVVFDKHKGLFFDAVRAAEKAIPDDTPNPGAAKADFALKLILKLEPSLTGAKEVDLQKAITAAHDALKA